MDVCFTLQSTSSSYTVDYEAFSSNSSPLLAKEKTEDDLQFSFPSNFADNSTEVPTPHDSKTPFLNFIETLNLLGKCDHL